MIYRFSFTVGCLLGEGSAVLTRVPASSQHNRDAVALHNTHAPVEAPERFVALYNTGDALKNKFLAMVSVVDESVRNVTDALVEAGMWNDTLLVWTTDNGSPVQVAGSNHPLKGGKSTNWEGM